MKRRPQTGSLKFLAAGRAVTALAMAMAIGGTGEAQDEAPDFNRDILPILSENCFACHGPDANERKADLRLDQAIGATRDLGDGHAAILPGNPGASLLVARIETSDPDEVMPPPETGKTLTSEQKEALRRWIANDAVYESHWAFRPIEDSAPPSLSSHESLSGIDHFLLDRLQEKNLSFSEPASRGQLVRRATFDLTGLPPKWADVKAFVEDPRPDREAFADVIDRLLASPAYGERWGRHWLDLARYADTHGGSAIGFKRFPFSYTYRDYVISAFNADLPYDDFLLEQLAADQLKQEKNDPALAALGFLTVGRQYRNVHDRLDDQIDVISRGLLGLTVSCARCHDHKFDPIPTTDYYALHASLAPSRPPRELPLVGEPDIDPGYEAELEKRKRLRNDIIRDQGDVMRGRLRMQVGLYLAELAKGTPEQDTSTTFLSYRTEDLRPVVLERWRDYLDERDESDPVFGPWHQLARLAEAKDFSDQCRNLVAKLQKENGNPKKFEDEHRLATKAPKWNPRILDALAESKPESFVTVAKAYGRVFADTHRRWLNSLLDASLEAAPEGTLVPDQDPKHAVVNSAIERQLRHHLYDPESPTAIDFLADPRDLLMLNRGVRDSVRGTLGAIETLNHTASAPARSMSLREEESPEASFVFLRGNPVTRGEPVTPRFLSAVAGKDPSSFQDGKRRLGLARAIVDPENPLTRRVLVNWVWQHHFGKGLVRTPDDFGTRGDPPTHPELLDFLAERFLEDDWSLKKLHRRLMLTTAYRQASKANPAAHEKDPDNHLLWRMPIRRLSLEEMRDSLLAVSGELTENSPRGGKPFEEKGNEVVPRRSVYAFLNRDVISPLVATFDGADPSACTVERPETTVPQQTLFALNSDFIQDRARIFALLPGIREAPSDEERVARLYQRALSRPPEKEEIATALHFVDQAADRSAGWEEFAHALLASNEFHFLD
ncbi:MAG: PSD1 and planctomycete cytochrome C domain-containing protein [Verrucomicrobiales bacterium]|nr:PSD1 and planctomycete cytochrome C domain-containing protein [Verrucomicrobiales bacterium]